MIHESKQALLKSGRVGEFGKGEFMQWWWTWFSDGGMEKMIEFIGKLFDIIMTVISNPVIAWAIVSAIIALSSFSVSFEQLI